MEIKTFKENAEKAVKLWEQKHNNTSQKDFLTNVEQLKRTFDPSYKGPRVPFKELMTSSDFGILFQRVVTDRLQMPVEPQYIGVSLFSRTIPLEANTVARFPIMGAVVAADVPNNLPIPRQDPAITQQVMSVDALRSAVAFDLEPELIDDSMYNIIGFLVEAGRRALIRHKEKKVWDECLDRAYTMFDNFSSDSDGWTSGKASNGTTLNGSFAFDDMIDMMAGLVVNGYTPTDLIANPLAWAVWHKDPVLRAQFFTLGQVGNGIWSKSPDISDGGTQSIFPWGVQYHTSRFMPVTFAQTDSDGVPDATGSANVTDFLLIDRNNPVTIVEREGLTTDRWETKEVETITLAMKEKYAVYGFDGGRSAVKAKNIRLVQNFAPLFNVGQVTP